jgi:hypothetical protein
MIPDQLFCIRQSLNKAYRLGKPGPAAIEAFKGRLVTLLHQAAGQESEEKAKIYLMKILQDTCFAAGYEDPQSYSSPVCYAHAPGLREGFAPPFSPELQTSPNPEINSLPGTSLPKRLTISPDLREALHATTCSVRQILSAKGANPQAGSSLGKQIAALVCQLYGLNPEEMVQPGKQ